MLAALLTGAVSWVILLWNDRRKRLVKEGSTSMRSVKLPAEESSSTSLIDYEFYELSIKEKWISVFMIAMPAFMIGYVFYKNVALALLFSAVGLMYPKVRKKQLIQSRKGKLNVQFKQALSCLSSSLSAGKSIETAFREALEDLRILYPGPTCLIVNEFGIICRRLENGEPIEAAVLDFAKRSNIEDATSFADVFVTCKRTGGNLVEVMKHTSEMIGEKLEIKQDISVMIAQKKFESRVLLFAPILIVAVLSFSSPEYMEPLYKGIGFVIMTFCLIVLGACFWLTQKIMNIKV
ncbi:type II secretion system F family protein [Paenibacillus eucommiae]|nr:type II secretion system F family protein [Paenibacillus eucommiae]